MKLTRSSIQHFQTTIIPLELVSTSFPSISVRHKPCLKMIFVFIITHNNSPVAWLINFSQFLISLLIVTWLFKPASTKIKGSVAKNLIFYTDYNNPSNLLAKLSLCLRWDVLTSYLGFPQPVKMVLASEWPVSSAENKVKSVQIGSTAYESAIQNILSHG